MGKLTPEQEQRRAELMAKAGISTPKPSGNLTPEQAQRRLELQAKLRAFNAEQDSPFPSSEQIGKVFNTIDKYSGAPVRQTVSTLAKTRSPLKALSQGIKQIGKPTNTAPTGEQQMADLGVPEEITPLSGWQTALAAKNMGPTGMALAGILGALAHSPRKILGFAAENAQQPLNLLPWAASKGLSRASKAISEGAQQNIINKNVKDIEKFTPWVNSQIEDANTSFNRENIIPKMGEQEARVADKTIRINPDDYLGIDPEVDKEMQLLKNALNNSVAPAQAVNTGAPITPPTTIEIPGKAALTLRAQLNNAANFSNQHLAGPAAMPRAGEAANAASDIRSKINALDPNNLPQISSDLQKDYELQKAVTGQDKALSTNIIKGTDLGKQSNLKAYDIAGGTPNNEGLEPLARRAKNAQRMYGRSEAANTIGDLPSMAYDRAKGLGYKMLGPVSETVAPYTVPYLDAGSDVLSNPYVNRAAQGSLWLKLLDKQNNQGDNQ